MHQYLDSNQITRYFGLQAHKGILTRTLRIGIGRNSPKMIFRGNLTNSGGLKTDFWPDFFEELVEQITIRAGSYFELWLRVCLQPKLLELIKRLPNPSKHPQMCWKHKLSQIREVVKNSAKMFSQNEILNQSHACCKPSSILRTESYLLLNFQIPHELVEVNIKWYRPEPVAFVWCPEIFKTIHVELYTCIIISMHGITVP